MAPHARVEHSSIVLEVSGLSKEFPGSRALDSFGIVLRAGSIHSLVGQNGCGKSTFIKILSGYHLPDGDPEATFLDSPLKLGNPLHAADAGIRFVHQDLGLVGSASAVENLAMVTGYQRHPIGTINWRAQRKRTRLALQSMGYEFDVDAPVASLRQSEQVGVAIARAIGTTRNEHLPLLVLDEPTVALPHAEVERLFEVMQKLKRQGTAILFVSHRLDEVLEVSDEITVLRDGRRITTTSRTDIDEDELITLILGREMDHATDRGSTSSNGDVRMSLRGVSATHLHELDLDLHGGEILGIGGLTGSGREEVAAVMFGSVPSCAGEILIDGEAVRRYTPPRAMSQGVGLVPADRRASALLPDSTIRENLTLASFRGLRRGPLIGRGAERADTRTWMDRLSVKADGSEANIMSLSGGNQQKVLIARWLRISPRVLILDEPTQGVDVGAKPQIYELLRAVAVTGAAVVICSTDTEELTETCDRVVILSRGSVAAELTGDALTVDNVNHELVLA
jgi:ribose transport system ATP-binding protein